MPSVLDMNTNRMKLCRCRNLKKKGKNNPTTHTTAHIGNACQLFERACRGWALSHHVLAL